MRSTRRGTQSRASRTTRQSGRFLPLAFAAGALLLVGGVATTAQEAPKIFTVTQEETRAPGVTRGQRVVLNRFQSARFDQLLRPDFSPTDQPLLATSLDLDRSQRLVLEMLIQDYLTQLELTAADLTAIKDRIRTPQITEQQMLAGTPFNSAPITLDLSNMEVMHLPEGGTMAISMGPEISAGGDLVFSSSVAVMMFERSPDDAAAEKSDDGAQQESRRPAIDPEQLDRIRKTLESRLKDQADRLAERLERKRQELETADDDDKVEPEEALKVARKFREEKSQLRGRFISDLNTILSPAQQEKLEPALDTLRVTNGLRHGRISAETLNVTHLVRSLGVQATDPQALDVRLDQWVSNASEALQKRTEVMIDQEIAAIEFMIEDDPKARLELAQREAELRIAVRDTNRAALDEVAELLDESEQQHFVEQAHQRAFPRIFAPTPTQRALQAALQLEILDNDARAAIQAMLDEYEFGVSELNEEIYRATLDEEPRRRIDQMEFASTMRDFKDEFRRIHATGGGTFELPRPPMMQRTNELHNKRNELGQRMLRMLADMLTEEQFDALPLNAAQKRVARGQAPAAFIDGGGGRVLFDSGSGGTIRIQGNPE